MTTHTEHTIAIQPGALLATAPAATPVETLNAVLQSHGLCLPIAPLTAGLTLAEAIERNAGGLRQLGYGTIARYLRAATLSMGDEQPAVASDGTPSAADPSSLVTRPSSLVLGGPTLKRATGYGLNRALVAGGLPAGAALHDVTLSLRPQPRARRTLQLPCTDLAAAARMAQTLAGAGLALSALALWDDDGGGVLLVELEGSPAVVERQAGYAAIRAAQAGYAAAAVAEDALRQSCADRAGRWLAAPLALSLTLPRAALPDFIASARAIAGRYRLDLSIWGDAGVGRLHLLPRGDHDGEARQAAALIYDLARGMGGALSTELGMSGLMHELWQGTDKPIGWQGHRVSAHPVTRLPARLVVARLREALGERHVVTRPEDLDCYTQDASIAEADGAPLAVVLPGSTAEVSLALRLAAAAGLPVVTRGAGSGLAGGATPSAGALLISLSRMERLHLDPLQMVAHVEAGAITGELQRQAEAAGLFYPPDPSSLAVSTLGGNIACNAGGPRCLKYGVTADYVLGLTAVLADGTVIQVGDGLSGQTPDAALLQLLIGSEGTLAVLAAATLRLVPLPAARRTTMAVFDRLADACSTVETIMAAGLIPAGLEIMDDNTIRVVEDYLHLGLPREAEALLLMLADGEPESVAEEAARLAELARRGGARSVQVARSAADEAALWRGRRAIAPALARLRPNRLGEDISVPVTRIAECVRRIKGVAGRIGQPIAVFGHAGDGNLHPNILFDGRDPAQVARVWQAAEAIFQIALELGGTLSGEHGIGTLKRPFMEVALGREQLALQRSIKAGFDPHGRLNPGKVLP